MFFSARLVKTALTRFAQTARTVQEGDNGYQIDEDGEEEYDQNDAYYEDEVAEEEIEYQFPERARRGDDSFVNSRMPPVVGRSHGNGEMQMDMRGTSSTKRAFPGGHTTHGVNSIDTPRPMVTRFQHF